MTFQSHCIMSNQESMKTDMNYCVFTKCSSQTGNIKILPNHLKEYGFKIFNLELLAKRLDFPCIRKIRSFQYMTANF